MASLSSTVQLIFGGTNQVTPTIRAIERDINGFSAALTSAADPFADLATAVINIDLVLAALGVTLAGLAANESIQMESALLDLQKQLDETDRPIEDIRQDIKALALEYGVASTELISSTASFKQAGFDLEGSLLLVKDALDLIVAGDIEAAQASEIIIAALKGFKAEAGSAAQLVEVLNAASNAYATDVQQLGVGMAGISPIANQLGLSFEETADLLVPIIEVFRSGDEAAIALKTGLLSLLSPSGAARAELERLGIVLEDANGNLRNGRDITFEVAAAFTQLDDTQKVATASIIFGKDQAARLIEAFDALGSETVNVAEAMSRVPSVADEVATRLGSAQAAIDRTVVAFKELGATTGDQFRVQLQGIIQAFGELAQGVDAAILAGSFDDLFRALRPKLDALEDIIRDVAKNIPAALENVDFSNVVAAFEQLGIEATALLRDFFGEIDIRTVDGLTVALQRGADAFAALINVTAGIVQSFGPLVSLIGGAIDQFSRLGGTAQQEFGLFLGFAKQVVDFGAGVATVLVTIGQSGLEMGKVLDVAFGSVKVGVNSLQIAFDTVALAITKTLESIAVNLAKVTFGDLSKGYEQQATELRLIGEGIKENLIQNSLEAREGLDQITNAFADGNPRYAEAQKRLDGVGTAIQAVKDNLAGQEQVLAETSAEVLKYGGEIQKLEVVNDDLVDSVQKTEDATAKLGGTFSVIGAGAADAANDLAIAGQRSEEFRLKVLELENQLAIAALEGKVSLDIAEFEANTRVVEAAFESIGDGFASIDNTITNTGDLLGQLTDAFLDAETRFDQAKIEARLDREEDRRDRALELQEDQLDLQAELTRSQIRLLEERARRLAAGDALIQIDGTNLEPELEAFMFRILEAIQVRANEESAEFLLGIGPA